MHIHSITYLKIYIRYYLQCHILFYQETIGNHAKSNIHTNIISRLQKLAAERQRTEIFQDEQNEEMMNNAKLLITSRIFRTVFVLNKLSLSHSDHAGLVTLQKLNGLDMGNHHYERTSCTRISVFISQVMHKTLIGYLIKNQMPISIIVDDSTGLLTVHYKIVYFQTIEDNSPVIYFYKLIELKAETGEANFECVKSAWENEGQDFYDYMQKNLIGFASDGASNNVGPDNGMIAYLRRWASKPLFAVHCMAHRLELVLLHAFNVNANTKLITHFIDSTLNEIYSFYSHSHKRKTHLKQTTDSVKHKFYELKKIIKVRWVASDYSSMKALKSMWNVIAEDLRLIERDNNFQQKTRTKASELRVKITGRNFLLGFHIIYDIVCELSWLSLDMQKRSALLIDASSYTEKFNEIFNKMKTTDAKNLQLFLHDARCGTIDDTERCETITKYFESEFISYENTPLVNDEENLPMMIDYKNAILDAIVRQYKSYFPDGDVKKFNVLDPMNMPIDEASARTYGITKIADINIFFKITSNDEITKQWQDLLISMIRSDRYCQIRTTKTTASAFWSQLLKWPEIDWGTEIKQLVRTVLSLPISSAEAEKGFSTLDYLQDSR